jgi:cyclopropane fatty-acyl-phospholipid synthase-like methyltransferase
VSPGASCSTTPARAGPGTGRGSHAPRSSTATFFRGGECVPLAATVEALEGAGFEIRDVESLREHYALTLRVWPDFRSW